MLLVVLLLLAILLLRTLMRMQQRSVGGESEMTRERMKNAAQNPGRDEAELDAAEAAEEEDAEEKEGDEEEGEEGEKEVEEFLGHGRVVMRWGMQRIEDQISRPWVLAEQFSGEPDSVEIFSQPSSKFIFLFMSGMCSIRICLWTSRFSQCSSHGNHFSTPYLSMRK